MRERTLKHLTTTISGLVLAGMLAACSTQSPQSASVIPPPTIPEDYAPPSLLTLTPVEQLQHYKAIEKTWLTQTVARGDTVHPLPLADEMISPKVTWRDETYTDIQSFMDASMMTGVLAIKDGEIILENYAHGRTEDDRWTSFSVAKSVTSLLVGAALKDGYINNLDDPVTDYIPNLAGSGYDGVTVRQLITMTSGVQWNEDYEDPNSDVSQASFWRGEPGMNHLVSYMRRLPSAAEPGTEFSYKTGETDMAGILVAKATGRGLAQYLSEKIWKPYGMEQDAVWIVDRDGMERGGCCMSMTLRDYGRIGQFILDGGVADGEQVVPQWYLDEATSNQLQMPAEDEYGHFWWMLGDNAYAAIGIFGQWIAVFPDEGLVVAVNSAFPRASSQEYSSAVSALLESVRAEVE